MSFQGRISNILEVVHDYLMTIVQENIECRSLAETNGFVTLAFVVGFVTLLGLQTSSVRWALVIGLEYLICRSRTIEELLEKHVLPRLSDNMQCLIDNGKNFHELNLVVASILLDTMHYGSVTFTYQAGYHL